MHLYSYFQKMFKTGDLILFNGIGVTPTLAKITTNTPFSHCGLVLRLPNRSGPFFSAHFSISVLNPILDGLKKTNFTLLRLVETKMRCQTPSRRLQTAERTFSLSLRDFIASTALQCVLFAQDIFASYLPNLDLVVPVSYTY